MSLDNQSQWLLNKKKMGKNNPSKIGGNFIPYV